MTAKPGQSYANVGREHLLTEQLITELEESFRIAPTKDAACRMTGIAPGTYYRWCWEADNPDYTGENKPLLKKLKELTACAYAKGEKRLVAQMHVHAVQDPRSAEFLLACRDPETYGRRAINIKIVEAERARDADALADALRREIEAGNIKPEAMPRLIAIFTNENQTTSSDHPGSSDQMPE